MISDTLLNEIEKCESCKNSGLLLGSQAKNGRVFTLTVCDEHYEFIKKEERGEGKRNI